MLHSYTTWKHFKPPLRNFKPSWNNPGHLKELLSHLLKTLDLSRHLEISRDSQRRPRTSLPRNLQNHIFLRFVGDPHHKTHRQTYFKDSLELLPTKLAKHKYIHTFIHICIYACIFYINAETYLYYIMYLSSHLDTLKDAKEKSQGILKQPKTSQDIMRDLTTSWDISRHLENSWDSQRHLRESWDTFKTFENILKRFRTSSHPATHYDIVRHLKAS